MSKDDLQKVVVGALLVGAGLLTGSATLITVAAGVGVNWTSEGLSGLWTDHVGPSLTPGSPLALAYQRALRGAIRDLRDTYKRQVDSKSDLAAFTLLTETAGSVAQAQYPSAITSAGAAQETLTVGLTGLLLGHDQRQVDYISAHLLEATAAAFQADLPNDPAAWNQFHGWLIQQLAAQSTRTNELLSRLPNVLAELQNPTRVLQALDTASDQIIAEIHALAEEVRRLAAQSQQPRSSGPAIFKTDEIITDDITDIAGDQLINVNPNELPEHRMPPPTFLAGLDAIFDTRKISAKKVTRIAGSQYEKTAAEPSAAQRQTVVAVFANAQDTHQLALLQEARVLRGILEDVRDTFDLEILPAATIDDLSEALLRYHPSVLHISGHGSLDGLLFETGDSHSQLVPRAALVRELSAFTPTLQCVLLNACYSQRHTTAGLALGVPYVVSMRGPIDDVASIEFARGFYEALAAGSPIPFAYERGCTRIQLKNLSGAEVPQLWSAQNQ